MFDEDRKIAILLSRSKSRLGIAKTDSNILPYLTYTCNPKIGKYGFTFSDNKLELYEGIWNASVKKTIAQYLLQQMDTMSNAIKFWNMRKFILFFTGGLIMLSALFIFVNNFLASINDATYENEGRDFYRKNTFFIYQVKSLKLKK